MKKRVRQTYTALPGCFAASQGVGWKLEGCGVKGKTFEREEAPDHIEVLMGAMELGKPACSGERGQVEAGKS